MTNRTDMTQTDQTAQTAQTDKLYDHNRQQLSAMLDGELPPDQAKFMLRRLEHDHELAACWERWQVCGDILRGRHDALLPADFSQRVAIAIGGQGAAESTAVAPPSASTRQPRWARWGGGAALAASVAMAALFVGRQAPEIDPESTTAPVHVVARTTPAPVTSTPAPTTPDLAPDTATSTLATAVAVAAVPRRAAERRSRAQSQRAAVRVRRQQIEAAPVMVAINAPATASPTATRALVEASVPPTGNAAADPFATHPLPARPWPRAILPNFPAEGAFTASYDGVGGSVGGGSVLEHPFHPFEPRVELQPAPADDRPGSGPR